MSGIGRVLAVGAAGNYAHLVVPQLVKRGVKVRALIHRAETEAYVRGLGADEVVVADLNDPASLAKACAGIDGVFHIDPEFKGTETQMGLNMVAASKDAGVRKFVFSSVQHTFLTPLVNHVGKLPVHEAIVESGMEFTVLLPTTFMQSIELFQWDHVLKTGVYSHPIKRSVKQSWVDYRDVAEVAAIALTQDGFGFAFFELAAGGMMTNEELVALMSKALGREIKVEDPAFDDYIKPFNIADPLLVKGYKAICDWYSVYGFPGGNNLSLRTILGRQPHTMEDYLSDLVERTVTKREPVSA